MILNDNIETRVVVRGTVEFAIDRTEDVGVNEILYPPTRQEF